MNPGIFVLGGGGAGGGSGAGGGKGGKNQQGASGNNKDKDATGGGKGAPGSPACGGCGGPHSGGVRGDPVDVVTGRVTTIPAEDFVLPGPLALVFTRTYCSTASDRDVGLGFGWGHSLAWELELRRRSLTIWDDGATRADMDIPDDGAELMGPRGWLLSRTGDTFELDTNDSLLRTFEVLPETSIAVLTKVRDRNGNTITIERDGRLLRRATDSAGRTLDAEREPGGRVGAFVVTLPKEGNRRARLVTFAYDDRGDLIRATDADGFDARYTYEDDHRLTTFTNRRGVVFHYVHDDLGRCVETWADFADRPDPSVIRPPTLADGVTTAKGVHHYRFTFGEGGYSEVAGVSSVERFSGTPDGRIDSSVHGGSVASRTYDDHDYLVAVADGNGAVTTFDRDSRGRVLRVVDPLGRTTTATRDSAGDCLEVEDPNGSVNRTTYDARGNILSFTSADGHTTSYVHDARGLLLRTIEPNGAESRATYDDEGNWTGVTIPEGGSWKRTFDGLGRKTSETDPTGATRRFSYSPRGDLLGVSDAAGGLTSYTYDGERLVTSEVDPMGARTECEYGAHGKLHRLRLRDGAVFEMKYALDGTMLRVVDATGAECAMEWDERGNVVGARTFDGRQISFKLDPANRLVASTDPSGQKYELEYDAAGQLTKRALPDGDTDEYEYDPLGNVLVARNADTEVRFVRDAAGRIVREEQHIGKDVTVVECTYGPTGELASRKTSLGHEEELAWTAGGKLLERKVGGELVIRRELDDARRERSRELSGGGRVQSAFDAAGNLAGLRVSSGAGMTVERRLQYDARGSLSFDWDSRKGGTRYEHDVSGNLVRVTHQSGADYAYRFDSAGQIHEVAEPRHYDAGGRLVRRGAMAYRYDDRGALIEKVPDGGEPSWRYEWTAGGKLHAAISPSGERIEYVYDCFGRRLAKRTADRTVRFVWDGDEIVHEVTEAKGAAEPAVRTFLFDQETWAPIAHRDGAPAEAAADAWVHYVNDDVGTPLLLTDGHGAPIADIDRTPWGQQIGKAPTPVGMPGQLLDEDTGLYYNRFRYYDPETGRYLSPDPAGLEGGANPYGYPHDPTRFADPLGLRFPDKVKEDALQRNRDANGGVVRCENPECNVECVKPQKSMKGDTAETRPSMLQEWQLDHKHPKSKGGEDTLENCCVLCRKCNRAKSDKV